MMTPELANQAYMNMLGKVPAQVAERLVEKYEANRADFISYVREVTPSSDPAYWAKRSCTKCYGRGILGELTTPTGEKSIPSCPCTQKNYAKWLVKTRVEYNQKLKELGHEKQTGTPQATD